MSEKEKGEEKIFVLDTNVILHDHRAIVSFKENDVIVPVIVLEELDKFKKGTEGINYQAREFVRLLDELTEGKFIGNGIPLGSGLGTLKIMNGVPLSQKIKISFADDIPDHRILAVAEHVKNNNSNKKVVFVTKDINLRMKAKSLGLNVEDYKKDRISNIDIFSSGVKNESIENTSIDKMYSENKLSFLESGFKKEPISNEYFILSSVQSALARYDSEGKFFERVEKKPVYGIKPRNAEQTFLVNALLNPEIKLVAITGKAGTGKTLLALASAIEQNKIHKQILLARPIVSLSNKDIGFLPGDAEEKIRPYMQPLFDNLAVIKNNFNQRSKDYVLIEQMEKEERLVIAALAYIRGRSLPSTFFIIDEAQNLTPHEIKTIITRAGEGTKLVFTGDINQIDSPYLDQHSNGLSYMIDRMRGQDIFAHVNLMKGERSFLAELASDLL